VREPIRATNLTNREQIPWGERVLLCSPGRQDEHMSLANAVAIVSVTRPDALIVIPERTDLSFADACRLVVRADYPMRG
jgi:hypothetical protein